MTPDHVETSFAPEFRIATPDFGSEVVASLGEGDVLERSTETYPGTPSVS